MQQDMSEAYVEYPGSVQQFSVNKYSLIFHSLRDFLKTIFRNVPYHTGKVYKKVACESCEN